MEEMSNPRLCPQCGRVVLSTRQIRSQDELYRKSLKTLRLRSSWVIRVASVAMAGIVVMRGWFPDRESADAVTLLVLTGALAGVILGETWARTANRWWMLAALVSMQIASVPFFAMGIVYFRAFLPTKVSFVLSALPLAASLSSWHDFSGYCKVLRRAREERR